MGCLRREPHVVGFSGTDTGEMVEERGREGLGRVETAGVDYEISGWVKESC